MSFDFVDNGYYQNPSDRAGFGAPVPKSSIIEGYGIPTRPQQQMYQQQQPQERIPQQQMPRQYVDPRLFETPTIVTDNNSFKFAVKDNPNSISNSDIKVDDVVVPEARKRGRPRKDANLPATTCGSAIVRPGDNNGNKPLSGTVENVPTSYTYMETTAMLHNALAQIDSVSGELMAEFEMVRANRAIKNKYGILNGLSENIGDLIANKIAAIKEINNSISKSNELDYKRYRDNKDALNAQNDDKYVSDLYTGFLNSNNGQNNTMNLPGMSAGMYGSSGIVRADLGGTRDLGNVQYTNYIANVTPEERLMLMEGNNNIRQAMVYDADTGNKAFQYFDFSDPSHPVPQPGLPTYSDILLDQFTVDLANRKAKSVNLKETMDLIVTNSNGMVY